MEEFQIVCVETLSEEVESGPHHLGSAQHIKKERSRSFVVQRSDKHHSARWSRSASKMIRRVDGMHLDVR